jgi:uncharacterized protein (TIGR02300 family)
LAKIDRGTKREDPDTGKKFYDLNKDPIVSPYTGKTYPRSYFDQVAVRSKTVADRREQVDEPEEEEVVVETVEAEPDAPEIVSLEEAEAEEGADGDEIPDVEDVEDVEDIGEDDADVFLEEDEDEDEDLDFEVDSSDER